MIEEEVARVTLTILDWVSWIDVYVNYKMEYRREKQSVEIIKLNNESIEDF